MVMTVSRRKGVLDMGRHMTEWIAILRGRSGQAWFSICAICIAISVMFMSCRDAGAESWYRWQDSTGIHIARDHPNGVLFDTIQMPDPIVWRNVPDMPGEIDADTKVAPQNLFKLASRSVYWVVATISYGPLESQTVIFGSAVAISENMAITNCHVVARAGSSAAIGSSDQKQVAEAELVAANYETDRCVIKTRGMQLRAVAGIRRIDSLEIGETVYAIGNPQRLERTLSDGLISGKRTFGEVRMLQTTAPISPGSSGGGLFDNRGNLVGITTSSLESAQSINFAIPAEDFWK
jgi:S1-C subfamily serine protease